MALWVFFKIKKYSIFKATAISFTVAFLILVGLIFSPIGKPVTGHRLKHNKILLKIASQNIEYYRKICGKFPKKLKDLSQEKKERCTGWNGKNSGNSNVVEDSWDTPLDYFSTDDSYELASYGSDLKPGGFGYAADLYHFKDVKNHYAYDGNFKLKRGSRDSFKTSISSPVNFDGINVYAIDGGCRLSIDWGDGIRRAPLKEDEPCSNLASHEYKSSGNYTIKIEMYEYGPKDELITVGTLYSEIRLFN